MPGNDRVIRVLQVVQRFYPELGGLETHVAETTRRLAEMQDIEVTVLTTDRTGRLPREDVINGVRVIRRRSWPRQGETYWSPGLVDVIRNGGWDLVHVQGSQTTVPTVAMAAAGAAGIPYVLTFHSGGHSSSAHAPITRAQNLINRPLLARADRLVAVSRFERKRFQAVTGLPLDRFEVIANGGALPPVPASVLPTPGSIVTSGRLERYKGHHRIIRALPAVRQVIPDASLTVLGSGPYEQTLRDLAEESGVRDAVTFTHLLPAQRAEMANVLASASVMAALSDYEAHPVAVMEAVAMGLPVLGADIAGIGDLVEDGWVVGIDPRADDDTVARALIERLRSVEAAPHRAPDFPLPTWEGATASLAALYRDVLARRRNTPRRVVQVITTLTTGGAERQLESVVRRSRHRHHVIALYGGGPVEQSLVASGASVEVLGLPGGRRLLALPMLMRRLLRLRPDVVQVHLLSGQLWGLPAAKALRIPAISTEHSLMDDSIENRPLTRSLRALYLALNRWADRTIAVSEATRSRLRRFGVPASRITVVDNGIEFDRLAYSPTARSVVREELGLSADVQVVGAVGRLESVKRFPELLAAVAPSLERGRRELLIVGGGPLHEAVLRQAADLGVSDAVHLTGPRSDIPALLSAMDVLVSPSRDETFGMAVVEAIGAGLPVVHAEVPALDHLSAPVSSAFAIQRDGSTEVDGIRRAVEDALRLAAGGRPPLPADLRAAYDIRSTTARLDAVIDEIPLRRRRRTR